MQKHLGRLAQVSCPVAVRESGEQFALSQEAREVTPGALGAVMVDRIDISGLVCYQRTKYANFKKAPNQEACLLLIPKTETA